jgi:type IV pilus assembly protein PilQ
MITWQTIHRLRSALAFLLLSAAFAGEMNSIKSIQIRPPNGDRQEVSVMFEKPVAAPGSFVVNTPPRIVFDFVDASNGTGKSLIPVNSQNLRAISIAESAGRTRVVFNLLKGASYTTAAVGNELKVELNAGGTTASAPTTTQFAPQSAASSKESIRNVDFRRGAAGEGRIEIDLSSPNVGIDIRQQGKALVLEFAKTSISRPLERRMDVVDFGTPVQTIDTFSQGDSVKMVIEPKGVWEYSAYQTESRFIVEVKSVDEAARRLADLQRPTYKGDKLSLNFQNVEVRTVLQVIAEFTGKNIITSDTVSGSLTLRLKDVPWDQALDIILQTRGLDKRENGNVMWVAPREEITKRETDAAESIKKLESVEPTRAESFQLNYMRAEDLRKLIAEGGDKGSRILSAQGSVLVESNSNILIVKDVPSKLEEIRGLIQRFDVPKRQVMIEARIVVADDNFSRQLGVRLGVAANRTANNGSNTQVGVGGNITDSRGVLTGGIGGVTPTPNVNLPISGTPTGSLGITLLNAASGTLVNMELAAAEAEGKSRTVSSPRVITGDQQKATISQGKKYYVIVPGGSGPSAAPQEKTAALTLEVTPRITPDRRVFMELKVSNDTLETQGQFPVVSTKTVDTSVLVGNGDTAVLGGIYEQTDTNGNSKVPVLGDIPLLGNLFKSTNREVKRTELLIFITPKIIDDTLTLR